MGYETRDAQDTAASVLPPFAPPPWQPRQGKRAFPELRQAELQEAESRLFAQAKRYLQHSGQQKLRQLRHRHLRILHRHYARRESFGQHQPQEVLVFGNYIVVVLPGVAPDVCIRTVVQLNIPNVQHYRTMRPQVSSQARRNILVQQQVHT